MTAAVGLFAAVVTVASPVVFQLQGTAEQGRLLFGRVPPATAALLLDGQPVGFDAQGRFVIGFDRDAAPRARLVARRADGIETALDLTVAPRAWRLERIGMARPSGGPTAEFMRRREPELARIAAARAQSVTSLGWQQRFAWPARGRLTGRFGSQRVYSGGVRASFHGGTDVAAGRGAPVLAPADGVVTLAPPPAFSLEGNLVILNHGMGLSSAFLHLDSVSVREGQAVRQGERIGTVGATGRATGPHLHWGLVWNGARIDPETLAGGSAAP